MANDKKKSDTSRALADIGHRLGGAFVVPDRGKMQAVVEEYKQEMLQWSTNGVSTQENPMKRATQEHWYSLYLGKKRLESHGIQIQYEDYRHVVSRPTEEEPQTVMNYHVDGKYAICMVRQYTKVLKNYIRNGAIIGREQEHYEMDYYISRAQNKDGLYICPNCGAELPLDKLLDGCDYCKAKFDISAYDDKIMSVMKSTEMFHNRTTATGVESATPLVVVVEVLSCLAIFFGLMGALFTFGLSLIIALFGGLGLFFVFKFTIDNYAKIFRVVYRLQDYNPGFSEEEFIGSLDSKLKSIHYASGPQELAAFVKCDIASFLQNYQNIVDCETGKIAYKNFRIQGDYQYVELHREMKVMQDCGNCLKAMSGVVRVVLAKKLVHKLKNDVSLFRCRGCGASVSLVEGGKCKYCGNEIDYDDYDWVVVGYEHVKEL